MIELKEWQYKLIQRLSNENDKRYEILEFKGTYYINSDELMEILDDTQNNREYAEEKLVELSDEFDKFKERKEDNIPGLQKSLQRELNRLKEENDELKETLDHIQGTFTEDDFDDLLANGYHYYLEKEMGKE